MTNEIDPKALIEAFERSERALEERHRRRVRNRFIGEMVLTALVMGALLLYRRLTTGSW